MSLGEYLNSDYLLIILDSENSYHLAEAFCNSEALNIIDKKTVLISTKKLKKNTEKHEQLVISKEDMKDLLDLYRSYEFSDSVLVVEDMQICGSVWNYVSNGLLTFDEACEALLS